MSGRAHSPGPFRLSSRAPDGRLDAGGHIIIDAMGDSIGALAFRTGDHLPEEQLANARLFRASATMFEALSIALPELQAELEQREHGGNGEHVESLRLVVDQVQIALLSAERDQ